jgi:hypothetical protein
MDLIALDTHGSIASLGGTEGGRVERDAAAAAFDADRRVRRRIAADLTEQTAAGAPSASSVASDGAPART